MERDSSLLGYNVSTNACLILVLDTNRPKFTNSIKNSSPILVKF